MGDTAEGDGDGLPELTGVTHALRGLMNASHELSAHLARELRMNATDMVALDLLDQHGALGAAELARRLGIRSASATALIDRLVHAGHVERVRDSPDRRRITVAATPSARRATYAAWLPVIAAIDDVGRSLDGDEQRVVGDYLARVAAAMDRR